MPVDYSKYPPEWRTVTRPRILARAGNRCEWCGAGNGAPIPREGREPARVVLTIAHVDHNPAHNADANLAALCQRCHLAHDARQHAESARRTRDRKRLAREPLLPGL